MFLTLGWARLAAGVGRDKRDCRCDQKECSHNTSDYGHFEGEGDDCVVKLREGRNEPDGLLSMSSRFEALHIALPSQY